MSDYVKFKAGHEITINGIRYIVKSCEYLSDRDLGCSDLIEIWTINLESLNGSKLQIVVEV